MNIKLAELRDNSTRYIPVGLLIGLILYMAMKEALPPVADAATPTHSTFAKVSTFNNMEILGLRLFEDLGLYLIVAGYILLLAMVGAIVLTLGHEGEIKRQDIFEQVSREG